MEENKHENNVYAFDIKNIPKHISEVESGRKGYYCMGCGREMQAKKGDILTHHFAHDPKDILKKGKCVFSDETYRHQLAKEILQRIKQIKVPNLYKYPPTGIEGKPNKLREAWTVFASTVKNELTFYEDENGTIRYGRDIVFEGTEKFLLIKPDVTFFDKEENPILLIEIVVTHKIDKNKLIKIRKLGIDTVQVTIPKESPEEIENTFFKTNRTEWIYNYEQEQTTYIPTPKGDSEGISSIDEFQRRLFEAAESYECRASQIKNLIRGINKCLESEQFRRFKQFIGEEIQRVADNTERNRVRLRELQGKHERAIQEEFRLEEEAFGREEREFRKRDEEFAAKVRDYETRYHSKRNGIYQAQRDYEPDCQAEIDRIEADFARLGTSATTFGDRIEEIREEENRLERYYRSQAERIEERTREEAESIIDIERTREGLSGKYLNIEQGVRAEFERKASEFEEKGSGVEREAIEIEARTRDEFNRYRIELITAIEKRDSRGLSRISRGLNTILGAREHLNYNRTAKNTYKRLRRFKEIFDEGTFKNWT